MRKPLATTIALAVSIGFVGTAFAQRTGGKPGKPKPAQVKEYDFEGDTIDGDLLRPDGSNVDIREFGKHGSLIRLRTTFVNEILKSAEDL